MTMLMGNRILKVLPVLVMLAGLPAWGTEEKPKDLTPFINTMIRELRDSDFRTRRCAARALGKLGPRAAKAVPALQCAEGDEDCTVREEATKALSLIQPELARGGGGR